MTFGLAIFFNILLAGSVCGTFAWYTYATRTGFEKEYHGVTIGDPGDLQMGIVSFVELDDYLSYKLIEDKDTLADEGKIIYWCEHTIDTDTVNYIIGNNGSATYSIRPVTTGSDDVLNSSGFHLFNAPTTLSDYALDSSSYAEKDCFVYIPLVFRYYDPDLTTDIKYVPNKEIFLTKVDVSTSEDTPEKEVYKSIRVFTNSEVGPYLINPTAVEDGQNNVGGILDLNNDGFYDYDESGYEHIYGESKSYAYNADVTPNDGTIPSGQRTTFVSNHKKDKYALNEETYIPKTVSYHSMEDFVYKAKYVTITREDYHFLATLDFYVYSEGWDLHVIDEEKNSKFKMDVGFEVNL